MTGTPPPDIVIDADLVRSLVRAQHPDLAELPVSALASGWDNAIYRLGENHLVRLPRRAVAEQLLRNEQRWLPSLASRLPLPIPSPLRIGVPSGDYPWHWSIVPWLAGVTANESELRADQAEVLANFLRALHVAAPADAPRNPVRGVPLKVRATAVNERIARLQTATRAVTTQLLDIWTEALDTPIDTSDTWIHGDLHARNVLAQDGRLVAVIDWGDVAQGDRATDLAAIWTLFSDLNARTSAMQIYGGTSATWKRAKGWAFLFGVTLLDTGRVDNPAHAQMGQRILERLAEGP